ncbi:hypothetical protein F5H01DRAFT_338590 [Linnemannia elongata]|nr:hypothetical protein F5H01DRAFT_338590 [Linnemannia elongata]
MTNFKPPFVVCKALPCGNALFFFCLSLPLLFTVSLLNHRPYLRTPSSILLCIIKRPRRNNAIDLLYTSLIHPRIIFFDC